MTVKVEELVAELKADVSDLKRGFNVASKEASKTSRKISKSMEKTEKSFAKMGKAARLIGPAIAAIAGAAIVRGLAGSIIEYEKMQASLVTVTGSAENAALAFSQIQKFTATTPFQITEVTDAFIKLKALGLDPSEDALRSYGNTASAMGKSLNQFIEAVADAATGEFERLKEFGIKASVQGDKVKFRFKGLSTTIGNNTEEIERFLRKLGKTDFAGAMERQMDTLGGAVSNMGDSFFRLATVIGEAGLSKLLVGITRGIISMTNAFADFIEITKAEELSLVTERIAELKDELEELDDEETSIVIDIEGDEEVRDRIDITDELENLQEQEKLLTKTVDAQTKAQKDNSVEAANAAAAAERFKTSLAGVIDKLDPVGAKMRTLKEQTEILAEALKLGPEKGGISLERYNELLANSEKQQKKLTETVISETDKMIKSINDYGDEFTDILADAFLTGKGDFSSFAQSIIRDLIKIQIQKEITGSLFGGSGGGGFFSKLFKGSQGGGRVTANEPILVGERRPEIFIPDMPGRIQSRAATNVPGAPGITVNQNIVINAGVSQTIQAEIQSMMPKFREEAVLATTQAIQKGGRMAQLVGARR